MMSNHRMFVAKYLGPTNTKGTRIKIMDCRFKNKSVTCSWDYELGLLITQALSIFDLCNIKITGYSEPWNEKDKTYFFTEDFSTELISS